MKDRLINNCKDSENGMVILKRDQPYPNEVNAQSNSGVIFDIKRYAIHDGPGIRTTVFFHGCPLNCPWCHNPEALQPVNRIIYRKDRCIACSECIHFCPNHALSMDQAGICIDELKCEHCGGCVEICPAGAREIIGRRVGITKVLREIEKDILFYDESGGGVTFSGGEPLMQHRFLTDLLAECGKMGVHTIVDTSGYADTDVLMKVAGVTDLFLYDLKFMDAVKHRKLTGVDNKLILTNLKRLNESDAEIVIRFPIIPGVNNDDKNIEAVGEFISALSGSLAIHLLPYHSSARHKYRKMNVLYFGERVAVPTENQMQYIAQKLEAFGLRVKIGG